MGKEPDNLGPLEYESEIREIQYVTGADGSLPHYQLPSQAQSYRAHWIGLALSPFGMAIAAWCIYHDVQIVLWGFVTMSAAVVMIAIPCLLLRRDRSGPFGKTFIDASAQLVTVRGSSGSKLVTRDYRREKLRALAAFRNRDDEEVPGWMIRVHGVYEWGDVLAKLRKKSDAKTMACRLRLVLNLPEKPEMPDNMKDKNIP